MFIAELRNGSDWSHGAPITTMTNPDGLVTTITFGIFGVAIGIATIFLAICQLRATARASRTDCTVTKVATPSQTEQGLAGISPVQASTQDHIGLIGDECSQSSVAMKNEEIKDEDSVDLGAMCRQDIEENYDNDRFSEGGMTEGLDEENTIVVGGVSPSIVQEGCNGYERDPSNATKADDMLSNASKIHE